VARKIKISVLLFAVLFLTSTYTRCRIQVGAETLGFESGLNYLSYGNRFAQDDSVTDVDFAFFKANNVSCLSIRIFWKSMTYDNGSYNVEVLNNYKRLLTEAQKYGLKVQFDFWTPFSRNDSTPVFLTSMYDIIRNSTAKQQWLAFVSDVMNELKPYNAIESWTMMNEPHANETNDEALFYQCWDEQRTLIKNIDQRPVSIRFALGDSPWSGNFSKTEAFQVCDYIAMTEYLDPSNENYTRYDGNWIMFNNCVSDCKNNQKPLVITEFGSDTGDDEDKRVWYEQSLALFKSKGIQKAYAWAWQTTEPDNERFNIASQPPKPTFNELSKAATSFGPTPTPSPTPIPTPSSNPTPQSSPTPFQPTSPAPDGNDKYIVIAAAAIIATATISILLITKNRVPLRNHKNQSKKIG
jgi:hypothetical protein